MPDRPRPVAVPADGWVQFAGDGAWHQALFTTTSVGGRHQLLIERPGVADVASVDLADVTALEELLGGPAGYHHVEIAVRRSPAAQAVWPPEFTEILLGALQATVEAPPLPGPSSVDEPGPVLVGAGVGATPGAFPAELVDLRPPSRRANAGIIGALALVGCGALVIGALGLRDSDPASPVETKVLTQTTLRAPTPTITVPGSTTVAPPPTLPSVDDCSPGSATTIAEPETADGCEPG